MSQDLRTLELTGLDLPAYEHPLPGWVEELRPAQVTATEQIVRAFGTEKHVILSAPTGAGKTLIAELVRRQLGNVRALFSCTTKTLQDQFLRDFPYSHVLKGRTNYPTVDGGEDVNAGDCTWDGTMCMWCPAKPDCPYEGAKHAALAADLAVLNLSYLLTEANGPGRFGGGDDGTKARPLVILDEADLVESALLGHVGVEFGPYWQKRLGLELPRTRTHGAKSNDWVEWSGQAHDAARKLQRSLPRNASSVAQIRFKSQLGSLAGKLAMLEEGLQEGQWVMQIDERPRGNTAIFKPVKVDHFADRMLWRHGGKFLLMSGSVVSAEEMADSLGIEDYELVTVPMEWPAEQRPIFSTPVTSVSWKNRKQSWPKLVSALENILAKHPTGRVLVHTVSYALAKHVSENLSTDRPVFTYTSAKDRETTLEQYRQTEDAVLLASSMDRGVDLPDEACEIQVILKVPFPNLGDKQVSQRLNATGRSGKTWYAVTTVRSILQMVGRGMRHKGDTVTTYICDKAFEDNILVRRRRLFPSYFLDALIQDGQLTREIASGRQE